MAETTVSRLPRTRQEIGEAFAAIIRSEGFEPQVSPELGAVTFKYEGGLYQIWPEENSPLYLRLTYPRFWMLTSEQNREKLVAAVNQCQLTVRMVKYVVVDGAITEALETILPDLPFLATNLRTYLTFLQIGARQFAENLAK